MTGPGPKDVARMLRRQAAQLGEIADQLDPGGSVERTVTTPTAAPRPADASTVVAERDRLWREFAASTTPDERAVLGARCVEEARAAIAGGLAGQRGEPPWP